LGAAALVAHEPKKSLIWFCGWAFLEAPRRRRGPRDQSRVGERARRAVSVESVGQWGVQSVDRSGQ